MMNFIPGRAATFQAVADWAEYHRQIDDRRALARVVELWDHVPLSARKLDLEAFEQRFPVKGFDPTRHKSEAAYKAWRRKVGAVLKAYLAATGPRPAPTVPASVDPARNARARWDRLLAAIEAYVDTVGCDSFPPQRLIPITSLARRAAALGLGPLDLEGAALASLGAGLTGNERRSVIGGLRNLNALRGTATIAALLPACPYSLTPWPRRGKIAELPASLQGQIAAWLDRSCGGKWDPVAHQRIEGTSADDRSKKDVALRRYCAAALAEFPELGSEVRLDDLMTYDICVAVLRHWMTKSSRPLTARTIEAYHRAVKTVAAHNDVDVSEIAALEKTSAMLIEGKQDGKSMSPRVRRFCEDLLANKAMQTALLTMHIRARRLAQSLFDRAAAAGRPLSEREAERIRQLGVIAAFCAIETCAAPLRIENVANLRLRGEGADLLLPNRATPHARILLPGARVKNGAAIEASLRQDHRNGLDTLLWYVEKVRPLFPSHQTSEYLFPAVRSTGGLDKKLLRDWFIRLSRGLGLPMRPHNFRHAIASMLIQKHPGQYDAVAVLLGDTEATVRCYYAWVNRRMQIEAAQALVLEIANA